MPLEYLSSVQSFLARFYIGKKVVVDKQDVRLFYTFSKLFHHPFWCLLSCTIFFYITAITPQNEQLYVQPLAVSNKAKAFENPRW
jgi:hypothetical protein